MKIKSHLVTVLFLLLVFSTNSFTQVGKREMLDKIAVVVGEEVILMSEIASQIQMFIFLGLQISAQFRKFPRQNWNHTQF